MEIVKLRKGLCINLDGKPVQAIHTGVPVASVAWHAPAGLDLTADKLVVEGQTVAQGDALFIDRHAPDIAHVAPVSGRVVSVIRDARRKLCAIEIECCDIPARRFQLPHYPYTNLNVRKLLQTSGLWTQLRQRPFDDTPAIDATAEAIFITAMDTRPLAPDPAIVIAERLTEFQKGVDVLLTQTQGKLFIAQASVRAVASLNQARVEQVVFLGPHPAGLAGTHIQRLHPIDRQHRVWHIDYQDVIAVGALFLTGVLDGERVIALAGPAVQNPRLVRTHIGASVTDLTRGELRAPQSDCDFITGSVFAGHQSRWLQRFDRQVTVLKAHLSSPLRSDHSSEVANTKITPEVRGFVAEPRFDEVSPLRLLTVPLLRSLMMQDIESAETLGCLQLAEDDLEPYGYVCPVGNDYPAALRRCLNSIRDTML